MPQLLCNYNIFIRTTYYYIIISKKHSTHYLHVIVDSHYYTTHHITEEYSVEYFIITIIWGSLFFYILTYINFTRVRVGGVWVQFTQPLHRRPTEDATVPKSGPPENGFQRYVPTSPRLKTEKSIFRNLCIRGHICWHLRCHLPDWPVCRETSRLP